MPSLLPLLKLIDAPGSIGFLLVCLGVALVLRFLWPQSRRAARLWLVAVAVLYVVLALPVVATSIAAALPVVEADRRPAYDRLIVFDGDNRRGRVREAIGAFERTPTTIAVLGEDWVVDALVDAGIPRERIVQDTMTLTTRAQMAAVAAMHARGPGMRLAVIASRLQMPRVAALARAGGLDVALRPSPIDDEPPTTGGARFVPRYIALRVSRDALYEHAALAYYRWRGWIQ